MDETLPKEPTSGAAEEMPPQEITWDDKAPPMPGEVASDSHLPLTAYIVLLTLSAVSILAVIVGVSNYLRSADVIRGINMKFSSLKIIDDNDDLRAVGRLQVHNNSPLALVVEGCSFDLYLNRVKVGISSHAFWGTDLALDPGPHDRMLDVYRIVGPHEHIEMEFTMHLLQINRNFVRSQQQSDSTFWATRATCQVAPPYASKPIAVELAAPLTE